MMKAGSASGGGGTPEVRPAAVLLYAFRDEGATHGKGDAIK